MLLLVVFHENHIGTPHVAINPFQIVAGLALEKSPSTVIIIGTNDEEVVFSNEVPSQAVTRIPFDFLVLWKCLNDKMGDLIDLLIGHPDITKIG